ncbi:carboxymuconolactone decarboxylase [Rhodococcus sp. SC4]|uniref:carboxymuconolactone decarboxylase family protein n=1 Tax=unclassified Rhodococcus (in: high G+C Gram-positive bacteria) TaxID=192944 RepID=UPI00076A1284|nr:MULTISPECIES: carboxymuconolactone decarboxylase family protein [unclassified Rhodococcus (in: high G+C Gram-positive bacteria)]KXF57135.1 carboxymuconolactone decarboxylase [Rhodococcus sp. SC4]KXX61859.1 carboxymuconolactone decarboxylase [Rhodococcus sp. LB1]PBC56445.1 carboxymuconolactone decarboxylase [Rhodococcus sp. ACPA1]
MTESISESAQSTDLRALGLETMRSIVPGASSMGDGDLRDGRLGEDIVEIGLISVWSALWAREGLGRRDRSLVTLGILIALGASDELESHVRIALNNGLTRDEIAEVIYHAGGYAGFPRSMAARKAAREALGE